MPFGSMPARRKLIVLAAATLLPALLPARVGARDEYPTAGSDPASASPRRPRVAQPKLELSPIAIEVAPGSRVQFTARASGGEAILFSVKWSIREGAAGGIIVPARKRESDGAYTAEYRVPVAGGGPFHVVARLREFPEAVAEASIRVQPAR